LAKILAGIAFPQSKQGLLEWAAQHRERLEQPEPLPEVAISGW
jgi:hypothetical protein